MADAGPKPYAWQAALVGIGCVAERLEDHLGRVNPG